MNNTQPQRVILYDLDNRTPIIDYFFDNSTNASVPSQSKVVYSTPLTKTQSGNGVML